MKNYNVKRIPKITFMLFFLLMQKILLAQNGTISGKITDLKSNEPLQYSHIVIKGMNKGTITNEDGNFKIEVTIQQDTLIFSYLGYINKEIACSRFPKDGVIKLKPQDNILKEVTVLAENMFLYKLITLAAKELRQDRTNLSSKAFLSLESTVENNPLEVIQSYYNADYTNHKIERLWLKNGRIGMAPFGSTYFVSLSTSKILQSYDIIDQNLDDLLPANPLQFSFGKLKKAYTLRLFETINDENGNEIYHIKFKPKSNNFLFEGSIFINPKTHTLHKLSLISYNQQKAPFIPIKPDHKIDSLNMKIDYIFTNNESGLLLNNIHFSFLFNYIKSEGSNKINTNGIVYFYDINTEFYTPYFRDDGSISDYQKIVSTPYNKTFWRINNAILSSDKIKSHVAFFKQHGTLLNFDKISDESKLLTPTKLIWSEKNRISIEDIKGNAVRYKMDISKQNPEFNMYHLQGQIFMDINKSGDSILPFTRTVIDLDESYYLYPVHSYTDCFLNNYYDIIEIYRQKLEKKYSTEKLRLSTIRDLYHKTNTELDVQLKKYLRETERGTKYEKLMEWTGYVKDKLGIDNSLLINAEEELEGGIKKLETDVESMKKSIDAYNLGTAFLKSEKYDEAIEYLTESLHYDITNRKAYFNRALAYYRSGYKDLACKDIQMAKDLGDPDAIEAEKEICNN